MTSREEIERLITKYGEQHRQWIEGAIEWLDEQEPKWEVIINREGYVKDLFDHKTKKNG